MDKETNENAFELRNYDALLGRFKTIDPYYQYWSPYMAMGNSHPNIIDPDGGNGYSALVGAGVGAGVGLVGAMVYDMSDNGKLNGGSYYGWAMLGGAVAGAAIGGFGWDATPNKDVYNLVSQGMFDWTARGGGRAVATGASAGPLLASAGGFGPLQTGNKGTKIWGSMTIVANTYDSDGLDAGSCLD